MQRPIEVTLRIVVKRPPAGVEYALQKGRGGSYETVQKQRSTGKDLVFEFAVVAKAGRFPVLSGPFVQGPIGDKFVYIDIGEYAGQEKPQYARRLKVPLAGITAKAVNSGKTLAIVVPGTAQDGTPTCAYSWLKHAQANLGWKPIGRGSR